jgi:hypothetical protein
VAEYNPPTPEERSHAQSKPASPQAGSSAPQSKAAAPAVPLARHAASAPVQPANLPPAVQPTSRRPGTSPLMGTSRPLARHSPWPNPSPTSPVATEGGAK